ncbi:MAG: uroporphyrinogen decarboxylase [Pseudomonadota bacterium]|nr:uroporphyrinogen decarboxylase [Pseudomonadota bacterium]
MSLVLQNLSGKQTSSVPIWLMRQAGRYLPEYRKIRRSAGSFLDLCYSPKLAAEITLQPVRRFGFDAAILFSDILVIPDALGQHVSFEEGLGPILEPLTPQEPILPNAMDKLKNSAHNKLGAVYETIERVAASKKNDCALIGFAGGPWTVATYMVEGRSSRDFQKIRHWATSYPTSFKALVDILTDATIIHLEAQINAGVEVLQIFESHAGILDCFNFNQWVIKPTRRIVEKIKRKNPHIPIIGFPRGAAAQIPYYISETKVDAVSLDQSVPLNWATTAISKTYPVQGNLDPIYLLGDLESLDVHVNRVLSAFSNRPFVFNLGHGVNKETDPKSVERLVEIVRSYEKRSHKKM